MDGGRRVFALGALAVAAIGIYASAPVIPLERRSKVELHEKMAELHQRAAACLRQGSAVEDCHRESRKDCPLAATPRCPFVDEPDIPKPDGAPPPP